MQLDEETVCEVPEVKSKVFVVTAVIWYTPSTPAPVIELKSI